MKPSTTPTTRRGRTLLVASLVLNGALILLLLSGAVINEGFGTRVEKVTLSPPPASIKTGPTVADGAGSEPGPGTWAMLNQGDFPTRLARLRELGFPPSLARSIMIAQIRTTYTPRLRELEMVYQRSPYFRPKALEDAAFAEFRVLTKEENRRIREILGPDVDSAAARNLRESLPGTSDEKIAQLTDLIANYAQLRQELTPNTRGTPLSAEEREQMASLEKNLRAEMAALLTPQELEDYDLRTSSLAGNLRTTLAGIDVTEAEFRALYRLQASVASSGRGFIAVNGMVVSTPQTPEENRARAQAYQQTQEQIATTLGAERYAAYQRANDFNYRQTAQLVMRLDLPLDAANQVYGVQQSLQQRAQALQIDRTLASEDRTAQLAALAAEAQAKITAVLGPTGFQAYKQYGGSWMGALQPRPSGPAPVSTPVMIRN